MSDDLITIAPDEDGLWSSVGKAGVPFTDYPCPCRSEHAPSVPWTHRHHVWPQYAGGPDTESNVAYICPATHDWVHVILRAFEKHGSMIEPRQQNWPRYAYGLAVRGWKMMTEAMG